MPRCGGSLSLALSLPGGGPRLCGRHEVPLWPPSPSLDTSAPHWLRACGPLGLAPQERTGVCYLSPASGLLEAVPTLPNASQGRLRGSQGVGPQTTCSVSPRPRRSLLRGPRRPGPRVGTGPGFKASPHDPAVLLEIKLAALFARLQAHVRGSVSEDGPASCVLSDFLCDKVREGK